jgi:hypothetical protein
LGGLFIPQQGKSAPAEQDPLFQHEERKVLSGKGAKVFDTVKPQINLHFSRLCCGVNNNA